MENINDFVLDIEDTNICKKIHEFIDIQQKINNCNIVMGGLQFERLRNIAKEYPSNGSNKVINHLSDLLSDQLLDDNVRNVVITDEIVNKIETFKNNYLQSDDLVRGNLR